MRNRTYWTHEAILESITGVCRGAGRFPSHAELNALGQSGLQRAMSRNGGMEMWWEKMKSIGFPKARGNQSNTETGWRAERAVADILTHQKFLVERFNGRKLHYDLLVDGLLRIEVKGASLHEYARSESGSHTSCWYFHFGKRHSADLIALYRFDQEDVFLMPWYLCPHSTVSMGKVCDKYAKWRNNFNVVRTMLNNRLSEMGDLC